MSEAPTQSWVFERSVSTAHCVFDRDEDAEWKQHCSLLIKRAEANGVPVYLKCQDRWLFQLASRYGEA